MFEKGEGLNSELKFAVAATYDKFAKQWEMPVSKLQWVDLWAPLLERFTVAEINAAADHCVKEFHRPPVPVELIELATRVRAAKPLSDPIVSKLERMAYLILASEEFNDPNVSDSEIADACLIAAAIAQRKTYAALLPDVSSDYLIQELSGRAQMFATEAANWQRDAAEGKGYWADTFARERPQQG
ncbi:hypothetical protein [Burkholderia multivorans]|uniref:hypothetical protein n=1 Tax=Burkholderia multivorans TaxID=87883 RepID=UPI000D01DFD2|nr:hypothetical protein [Burkholderia multivorans]MBJ9622326.1 hypothetical protein [Burkholderia multivorans]MBU9561150.1 hypothetical protein [Burkholderia multivorans]MCA8225519.1 hypothetical protein [Burkholderia multivorans]